MTTKHNKNNQLYTQMEDVLKGIGELNLAIQLALHDEDQLLKEYGVAVLEDLKSLRALLYIKGQETTSHAINYL